MAEHGDYTIEITFDRTAPIEPQRRIPEPNESWWDSAGLIYVLLVRADGTWKRRRTVYSEERALEILKEYRDARTALGLDPASKVVLYAPAEWPYDSDLETEIANREKRREERRNEPSVPMTIAGFADPQPALGLKGEINWADGSKTTWGDEKDGGQDGKAE